MKELRSNTELHESAQRSNLRFEARSSELEALRREVERLRVFVSGEAQGLLDAVLHHSPHGVMVCDAEGRLTLHNRAAERIWAGSATPENFEDWSKYRAFHPDGRPYSADDWSMIRCLRARDVIPAEELWIQRFDGSRALLLGSCAPILGPQGEIRGALSVFADVTESHRLAAAERTLRERSERLQRITALLVQALTPEDVAGIVLQVVREALDADVGSLSLVTPDGSAIETLAYVGDLDAAAMKRYETLPLSANVAAAEAVRNNQAVFIESAEDHRTRYPNVANENPYRGGTRGSVPLAVGSHVFGSINFGFPNWRSLSNDERQFIRAAADQCAIALERSRLFEAERAARAQAEASQGETRLLFELSDAVNRADALEQVYEPALDAVIRALHVSRASVLLLDPDGVMRFKASRGLSDEYRAAVEGHSPWSPEEQEPRPLLVPDVYADQAWAAYRNVFEREGIRALGFIPLVHRRRLLGKFMVYDGEPRTFTQRELDLSRTIATQISQAVARARLLEAERLARADAERSADRVRRLQTVTASLSKAATPAQVARVVIAQGIAATGASTGGLWLLAGSGVAELVHAEGYSDQGRRHFARIDLNDSLQIPVVDVFRNEEAVWVESAREFAARYPAVAATAAPRPEYRIACLPITSAGRCVAALAFTFDSTGAFDHAEREFLQNVARQAGLALERSQLFEVERRARAQAEAAHRRASFKAEASAILASSLDYETTLKNVARLAVPKFADWCAVELADGEGGSTLVAVEHVDQAKIELAWRMRERYPADPEAPRGVPHVLRTGTAELYEEISDELLQQRCQDAEHLALARSLGLRSAINAPITVHGRTIGVISFICAESGERYDTADLEMAVLIGQRAALAIENARLHRDVQRAAKARDDVLAVVSHDLRNPLSTVAMKASILARTLPDDPSWAKSRKHAEGIQAAADRMGRLINDLLDVGSIEAGQLKVTPAPFELGRLLSTAAEEMLPFAAAKGIRLEIEAPSEERPLHCDGRRVLQVLENLIGNAIKFTPSGGSIAVRSSLDGDTARIAVSDSGAGIEPRHLSRVFERYYQAPSGERSGVGLGLFIARGIVTAHGGRIWAESAPGMGSTFSFTLPLASPDRHEDASARASGR